VDGHQRDLLGAVAVAHVHHQRNMLEEGLQVREFLHGPDQFLEVFEPPRGIRRALLLPHVGVAGFLQHGLGDLRMRLGFRKLRPAAERDEQIAQGAAGLRLQLVGFDDEARRLHEGHLGPARMAVEHREGGVGQPALRHVDDALEGEVVGGRHHAA
jgi:hypothetical protein